MHPLTSRTDLGVVSRKILVLAQHRSKTVAVDEWLQRVSSRTPPVVKKGPVAVAAAPIAVAALGTTVAFHFCNSTIAVFVMAVMSIISTIR